MKDRHVWPLLRVDQRAQVGKARIAQLGDEDTAVWQGLRRQDAQHLAAAGADFRDGVARGHPGELADTMGLVLR